LLAGIESRGLHWGVVTNKSTRLTRLLVKALGLEARAACVVCGDTTPHLKPHPASLLHAAQELALAPADCVYLGDDLRDVQAARAAGMRSIAVAWGYGENLPAWHADEIIEEPMDVLEANILSPRIGL
jgi:phosphoglycolate phosphatase